MSSPSFSPTFPTSATGDVETITLPQPYRVVINVELDRSAGTVDGPLNEVDVNIGALRGVAEGNSRGEMVAGRQAASEQGQG